MSVVCYELNTLCGLTGLRARKNAMLRGGVGEGAVSEAARALLVERVGGGDV